jgi:glycosyltransferase involved in cell wall biosynthesis
MLNTDTYPKVSIIMPTYNRAGYIAETIESIRNQTYTNWELLIMDDGSDDNTEEIVSRIDDERIKFFKCGRTGFVSKIKNEGIRRAAGELIAFNDSDDLWAPAKLEKQVSALNHYPEAGFSLTGGYTFKNKNDPVQFFYKQKEGIRVDSIFFSFFRSEITAFTQALVFRRRCVDVSGLFDETKPFSDADFILSLAFHFKAIVLFEPLLYRRLHEDSDSSEYWEERYLEWIGVIRSYRDKKQLPSTIAREALFKLYIDYGEKCLVHKKKIKAIKIFLKAWQNKPFTIAPLKKIGKAVLKR